jgi:hypothetical protein
MLYQLFSVLSDLKCRLASKPVPPNAAMVGCLNLQKTHQLIVELIFDRKCGQICLYHPEVRQWSDGSIDSDLNGRFSK